MVAVPTLARMGDAQRDAAEKRVVLAACPAYHLRTALESRRRRTVKLSEQTHRMTRPQYSSGSAVSINPSPNAMPSISRLHIIRSRRMYPGVDDGAVLMGGNGTHFR